MLIEFINSVGIRPLVVQSFRNPYDLLISHIHAVGAPLDRTINSGFTPVRLPITGLYNCEFDKINGFGFQHEDRYDILYTTVESLSNLPQNIQTIDSLSEYHGLTIGKNNIAHGKDLEGYNEFKKSCKLSKQDVDRIHTNYKPLIDFYYTDDQFEQMKNSVLND